MNAMKARLLDLARGWAGSDAEVSINAADANALGVDIEPGASHAVVIGRELLPLARALPDEGEEEEDLASPVLKSETGKAKAPPRTPARPGPTAPPTGEEEEGEGDLDGLDDMKVEDLRTLAAAEKIDVKGTRKADIVAEIRAARTQK